MRIITAFLINTLFNFAIGLLVAKFLGPAQFGRFAMAVAIGIMIQTISLEWIRLAAVRFYSVRIREERPEFRATLDAAFAMISLVLAAIACLYVLSGADFSLSAALVALAFCAAIANGLFDYHTALVRARFNDRLYGGIIILKNVLALGLTVGGAFFYHSAAMTLTGACIAMAGSVFFVRRALSDEHAKPEKADLALANNFIRYSGPIVAANMLYLAIPLANRALVTAFHGFAETGQFSLSFDIGTRLIAAVGSALDVLLFQMAVRADEMHGREHGKVQVAKNMMIVFAILLPATAGLWLILPSIQVIIVPQEFRGPFAHYLALLLPGMLAFGLMNFAINPVFQIAKRTWPLIAAAMATCVANPILFMLLPASKDASSLAIAQSGAFIIGLVVLVGFAIANDARWPRFREIALTLLTTGLMTAALWPLRQWEPGITTLIVQVAIGGTVVSACVGAFDIAGLRSSLLQYLHRRRLPETDERNSLP